MRSTTPPPPPPGLPPPGSWNQADAPAAAAAPGDGRQPRAHPRQGLPEETPARLTLANLQTVYVTLLDISRGGCCIVRKGRLNLHPGEGLQIDVWTGNIQNKLTLPARVCWVQQLEANGRAGLRFLQTTHRLQRQIETYIDYFRIPHAPDGPTAYFPTRAPIDPDELTPPAAIEPTLAPSQRRPRRGGPADLRAPKPPGLAAMPRPGRLSPEDLERRMRPVHRQEVARIAEQTGLHAHTLYTWLRSLRLEGEPDPTRPGDPQGWSTTDKLSALLDCAELDGEERQGYCERHGISAQHLEQWREAVLEASGKPRLILQAEEELQRLRQRDQREIRLMQQELRQRERALAITDELLQVARKLQVLWEKGARP